MFFFLQGRYRGRSSGNQVAGSPERQVRPPQANRTVRSRPVDESGWSISTSSSLPLLLRRFGSNETRYRNWVVSEIGKGILTFELLFVHDAWYILIEQHLIPPGSCALVLSELPDTGRTV
jgi:hypothetical protein